MGSWLKIHESGSPEAQPKLPTPITVSEINDCGFTHWILTLLHSKSKVAHPARNIASFIIGSVVLDFWSNLWSSWAFPDLLGLAVVLQCGRSGAGYCVRRPGFESGLFHFFAVWPWASHVPLSELNFLQLCKTWKRKLPNEITCGSFSNILSWPPVLPS